MAKFKKLITTNQGRKMINDSISTSNFIAFTKISSSTKIYTDGEISELTSLSDIKQTVNITRTSKVNDTSIEIEATINNTNLTESYTLGSIGLYATLNNVEILFAVASVESTDKGSYMPAYNKQVPTGIYIKLIVTVDYVDNIIYNINPTGYATLGDILKLENEIKKIQNEVDSQIIVSEEEPAKDCIWFRVINKETLDNTFYLETEELDGSEIYISEIDNKEEKITNIKETLDNNGDTILEEI